LPEVVTNFEGELTINLSLEIFNLSLIEYFILKNRKY